MTSTAPRPLVAGNWKMNGLKASISEARLLATMLKGVRLKCDVMLCPPATLLAPMKDALRGGRIALGAQDCHFNEAGAHTGDISPVMLKDVGVSAVILGHSERRNDHGETSSFVRQKAEAALKAGLTAIVCVGETLDQHKAGETLEIVAEQVKSSLPRGADAENCVLAYEPVWAIGTGLTPTVEQIAEVHGDIRKRLGRLIGAENRDQMRILYGGSVKPANARELMAVDNVNGALVGGASLKAKDFMGIISAYA